MLHGLCFYLWAVDDVGWGLVGKELVTVLSGVTLGALGGAAHARRGHDPVNASDGLVISGPTQNKPWCAKRIEEPFVISKNNLTNVYTMTGLFFGYFSTISTQLQLTVFWNLGLSFCLNFEFFIYIFLRFFESTQTYKK